MKGIMNETATGEFPSTIIIVDDTRCGGAAWFPTAGELRAAMLECGWTAEEVDLFLSGELAGGPANMVEAVRMFPSPKGNGYVYNAEGSYFVTLSGGAVQPFDIRGDAMD